jgi:hypothetical protein
MNISTNFSLSNLLTAGASAKTLRPSLALKQDSIDGFAGEITRRAAMTAPTTTTAPTVDDAGLTKAVTNAVDYVRDNFGNDAARATMGIVMSHAGQDGLTEDSLGQGFVSALAFIDKNFGTAQGDKAMGFFNGELNQSLNGYFQNGRDEQFMAVDMESAQAAAGSAVQAAVSQMMDKAQAGSADPAAALFGQAQKDLEASLPPTIPVESSAQGNTQTGLGANGESAGDALQTTRDQTAAGSQGSARSIGRQASGPLGYATTGIKPGVVVDAQV